MRAKRQASEGDMHSLKNRISELSELPKDVVLGIPMLTMIGQNPDEKKFPFPVLV